MPINGYVCRRIDEGRMRLIVIEDKGQQDKKHTLKHIYFESNGIYWERYPLPVGDYIIANEQVLDVISRKQKRGIEIKKMDFIGTYNVTVDTKKDMQEIVGNICGQQHARFRDEFILAQNNGISLYVLIENEDGITCLDDVPRWINPRLQRYNKIKDMHNLGKWKSVSLPKSAPTKGETLAKAMRTMEQKYGVTFLFCKPEESGARIIELLTGGNANG